MSQLRRRFEEAVFDYLKLDFPVGHPIWCPARYVIVAGGIRAGKSTTGAAKILKEALTNPDAKLYWLVGPDYVQTHEEFRFLLEWFTTLGFLHPKVRPSIPSDGSRSLTLRTGCVIETRSARYAEKLQSVAPDGIVMCEAGQTSYEVFRTCVGRIGEKRGFLFLTGTLENDEGDKPMWVWYEQLLSQWRHNPSGSNEMAFSLPTWTNKAVAPLGESDPMIEEYRQKFSSYSFARKIAALPVATENPCFPELWDVEHSQQYQCDIKPLLRAGMNIVDGAIGVDYGSSQDHPSTAVALQVDHFGRYWVRELWKEFTGDPDEISFAVEGLRRRYKIGKVRVDPLQRALAAKLEANVAIGSGGVEFRLGIANGLIQEGLLFFATDGPRVADALQSLRNMRRIKDTKGRLVYARDLGDDAGMACLYALEELRGDAQWTPSVESLGSTKMLFLPEPRARLVGRV